MKNSRRNDVDDDDGSIFCRLLQPLIRRSVLIVCTPYWRNTNTTMSDCGADDDGSGAQSKDRRQMEIFFEKVVRDEARGQCANRGTNWP